jgi:hypothetical protein
MPTTSTLRSNASWPANKAEVRSRWQGSGGVLAREWRLSASNRRLNLRRSHPVQDDCAVASSPYRNDVITEPSDLDPESIDDLNLGLFDSIVERLDEIVERDDVTPDIAIESLPRAMQVLFVTTVVDMEVQNGGFEQLIWNSPHIASLAESCFQEIEAAEIAKVAAAAMAAAGADEARPHGPLDGSFEGFATSVGDSDFGVFDDRYYELQDTVALLQFRYASNHKLFD